ncbi:C5a anaphylatoxin chemotactic receptor 1 [Neosynchiropus ocellatus]
MESLNSVTYDIYDIYEDYNGSDSTPPVFTKPGFPPQQIISLVCYSIVLLLGVPGNALVVWVTGFCMPRSVTSLWFLNLALADLLCCLSLPLLMVPLAHDDEWPFGSLACKIVKPTIYVMMLCSVLQLVVISLDRWMLVSRPVWCQNNRRPRHAVVLCVLVWVLALIGSLPHFIFTTEISAGTKKKECLLNYPSSYERIIITCYNFLLGFVFPLLVIVASHCRVYQKTESGQSRGRGRSKRTLKIIIAVVLSFFLCWCPLHMVNFVLVSASSHDSAVYIAHVLALCLAYFNSCLNPLLYVCLGRGFKDSVNRSLRNLLHFINEETTVKLSVNNNDDINETKTSSLTREIHKL